MEDFNIKKYAFIGVGIFGVAIALMCFKSSSVKSLAEDYKDITVVESKAIEGKGLQIQGAGESTYFENFHLVYDYFPSIDDAEVLRFNLESLLNETGVKHWIVENIEIMDEKLHFRINAKDGNLKYNVITKGVIPLIEEVY